MNKNENENILICPNCGNNNINVQIINEQKLVKVKHGCLYVLLIGWWLWIIKWLFFTVPALIFKIFGIGKKQQIVNTIKSKKVCQSCGHIFD